MFVVPVTVTDSPSDAAMLVVAALAMVDVETEYSERRMADYARK